MLQKVDLMLQHSIEIQIYILSPNADSLFAGKFTELICQYNLYGFPMTPEEIRVIAYDFAEDNNHKGFSTETHRAGRDWLNGFMKR